MIHLIRMPDEVSGLIRSGFCVSGKVGGLIYRTRGGKSHIYSLRNPEKGGEMAKIKYASFVTGLSGKSGSSVFYRSSSPTFGYLRNHVTPTYTDTNAERGKEFANLGVQYRSLTEAAKTDLRDYARKYRLLPASGSGEMAVRANNGMAVFVALLWAMAKEHGESFQLRSITINDITTMFMVTKLKDAIDLGYLPAVDGYTQYDADWEE